MTAIAQNLQGIDWRRFAITMTDDKLIGARADAVEAEMARNGFALVSPTG